MSRTPPQSLATTELVHSLRGTVLPPVAQSTGTTLLVGGQQATTVDFTGVLSSKLPLFIGIVVLLSALLLLVVFRSLVIPVQAAVMNLLSIGAAYGVLTAIFQWGWLHTLIGLDGPVPIVSYVPLFMFAILFGLSMDYEVFILARMREQYDHTRSTDDAIVHGVGRTGWLVTSAALIMFLGFVAMASAPSTQVKMIATGLGAGIILDATVVRALLLPAAVALIGRFNWWLPRPVARVLRVRPSYAPAHDPGRA